MKQETFHTEACMIF